MTPKPISRRALTTLAALSVVSTSLSGVVAARAQTVPTAPRPSVGGSAMAVPGPVAKATSIDVRALPAPTADHPTGPAPFVPRDSAAYATRNSPRAAQPGLRLAAVPNASGPTTGPSPLISTTTAFTMTSHDSQVTAFGSANQDTEPPDTQVAASATRVVEFNNNSGAIYDRAGGRLSFFDLYSLFAVPAGYSFSDPRILFDPASGRFVASGLTFLRSNNNSVVYVLVSQTSDPGGAWTRYTVPAPQNGTLYDQPKVGVSTDKGGHLLE